MRVVSVHPFPRDPSTGHQLPGFYGQQLDTLYHRLARYGVAADVWINPAARNRVLAACKLRPPGGFPVVVLGLPGVAVIRGANSVPDYHALGWPLGPKEDPT